MAPQRSVAILARDDYLANSSDPREVAYGYSTGLSGVDQSRNEIVKHGLWWTLGALALAILTIRVLQRCNAQRRLVATLKATPAEQSPWSQRSALFAKLQKHVLYAPFWKKRHNREIQLSRAGNMGTIPSRLHTGLLVIYGLSNVVYCFWLNYAVDSRYALVADLRGRSGVLAVYNMIPLVIFAGRNNPLIPLLQISFDTYNLFHRWIGRIVVVEAAVHTGAWASNRLAARGWDGMFRATVTDPFLTFGSLATVAMLILLLTGLSPVRHAFYETFLNVHIIMAFVAMGGVAVHCHLSALPQMPIVWAALILWMLERSARMARLIYINASTQGWTSARVQALSGEACMVTLHLPKQLHVQPGTHAYLRFASLNIWESHPFSIAWTADRPVYGTTLGVADEKMEPIVATHTDVSFVVHAQTGMTRRLYNAAASAPCRSITMRAALEGPYAGHHSLDSYGHAVLFAGSSGITHQMLYIRHLVAGHHAGRVSTRQVTLIWIVRDTRHLDWVRPWMDEILRMPDRRSILHVKIYVTRPDDPAAIKSPSRTVQVFAGRPKVDTLLTEEVDRQVGAMCVTVCGPGGLADNVRAAVRQQQHRGAISFIEESFTW